MTLTSGLALLTIACSGAMGAPDAQQSSVGDVPEKIRSGAYQQELATRVRSERRDPQWATQAEAFLQANYDATDPHVAIKGTVSVQCRATICMVEGREQPFDSVSQANVELLGKASGRLLEQAFNRGLTHELSIHNAAPQKPGVVAFTTYFLRSEKQLNSAPIDHARQ